MQQINTVTTYNEFRAQISELKTINQDLKFDYENPKEQKEARSHVYKMRQLKAAIEKRRVEAKADAVAYGKKVDEQAKEITVEIEAMIDVHMKPIEAIELREKNQIIYKTQIIATLSQQVTINTIDEMQARLESIDMLLLNPKDVFEITTLVATKHSELNDAIAAKKKHDEDMAELTKLRQAELERKQSEENERLEKERIQNEEQARLENERKAKEEKERQERLEQQQKEDAERKERIRKEEEQLKAERELLAKEQKEKERIENERIAAEREKIRIERERLEQQKRESERLEKERFEKEQIRIKQEEHEAQRKADIEHRRRINATIVDSLHSDFKVDKETARAIVVAILNGTLKHLLVDY